MIFQCKQCGREEESTVELMPGIPRLPAGITTVQNSNKGWEFSCHYVETIKDRLWIRADKIK